MRIHRKGEMDRQKVEQAVRLLMEGLGLNLNHEGLRDTPRRVSSMFIDDFFRDINRDPGDVIATFFRADYDEMVAGEISSFTLYANIISCRSLEGPL